MLKLSKYTVASDLFLDNATGEYQRVLFSTRTAKTRLINESGWVALQNMDFDKIPSNYILDLVDIEVIVPEDEDELNIIINRNNASIEDSDTLYMVIQPTASCQLGCNYCGQVHSSKKLSIEHQLKLLDRIENKLRVKKYKKLEIAWFGAEPLSGLSVMKMLSPQLIKIAENFNCSYSSKVVTNGMLLTNDIVKELIDLHKVNFIEVTIDGSKEYHDKRRHTKNQKETFDKIFNNILSIVEGESAIQMRIRCNVDRNNYLGVSPLLLLLSEKKLQNILDFYVAPIHSWGNDAHLESISPQEFGQLEINWLAEMNNLGFNVSFVPSRKPIVCLAVKSDSEVIDAFGAVFNCTEVPYVPAYETVSLYSLAHLSMPENIGEGKYLRNFNDEIQNGNLPCSTCEMLPVCGGSCPKQWKEGLVPCPTPKYNIKQRLILAYASEKAKLNEPIH